MITIYHNNSCTKSRIALAALTKSGEEFEVVNYLENIPSIEKLKEIIAKLQVKPHDLIRITENSYKEKFKDKSLTDEEWIVAMHENPILIQRPIIIKDEFAVIAGLKMHWMRFYKKATHALMSGFRFYLFDEATLL